MYDITLEIALYERYADRTRPQLSWRRFVPELSNTAPGKIRVVVVAKIVSNCMIFRNQQLEIPFSAPSALDQEGIAGHANHLPAGHKQRKRSGPLLLPAV